VSENLCEYCSVSLGTVENATFISGSKNERPLNIPFARYKCATAYVLYIAYSK
jgi:hypothetical protein